MPGVNGYRDYPSDHYHSHDPYRSHDGYPARAEVSGYNSHERREDPRRNEHYDSRYLPQDPHSKAHRDELYAKVVRDRGGGGNGGGGTRDQRANGASPSVRVESGQPPAHNRNSGGAEAGRRASPSGYHRNSGRRESPGRDYRRESPSGKDYRRESPPAPSGRDYRRESPPREAHRDPLADLPKGYRVAGSDYTETVMYNLDHLATFAVSAKQGVMQAEDGIDKLRQMDSKTGIWTMRVSMILDGQDIVIIDKQTGEEMERFPLELVTEPCAVTSRDRRDMYNNILLFTVREDTQRGSPTEMHIFQVMQESAERVVEDIKEAKRRLLGRGGQRHSPAAPPPHKPIKHHIDVFEDEARRMAKATENYRSGPNVRQEFRKSMKRPDDVDTVVTERTDHSVELLNHCFDDIEKFVGRLQQAADAFKELERRHITRGSSSKDRKGARHGDGMLTMRSRPPPAKDFIDVFQKFKLSFNLLAKLKPHIHDPNAPELVHFLFTPLSLVVEASKDPRHGTPDLATKVVSPLLSPETRELLLNCLTSKEADLWTSLGDAWTISREQWKGYVPPYTPRFSDGWKPNANWLGDMNEASVGGPGSTGYRASGGSDVGEERKERAYSGASGHYDDPRGRDDAYPPQRPPQHRESGERSGSERLSDPHAEVSSDPQEVFLRQLKARGSKIYVAMNERESNNAKELSVEKGDILEVLDDTRNWWQVRNARGDKGFAPYTILQAHPDSASNR